MQLSQFPCSKANLKLGIFRLIGSAYSINALLILFHIFQVVQGKETKPTPQPWMPVSTQLQPLQPLSALRALWPPCLVLDLRYSDMLCPASFVRLLSTQTNALHFCHMFALLCIWVARLHGQLIHMFAFLCMCLFAHCFSCLSLLSEAS